MGAPERAAVEFQDDEGGSLNAVWSRSGRRLIVTVNRRGEWAQVELRREQVDEFAAFLAEQP
jgi:hypothetical protein